VQKVGNGKTGAAKGAPGASSGLAAALAALDTAVPGLAVGIRLVGNDGRTRRLGNAAMNVAVAAGHGFDRSLVLAELANGATYRKLALVVAEPEGGLALAVRIGLVSAGLELLSRLDGMGEASAAA